MKPKDLKHAGKLAIALALVPVVFLVAGAAVAEYASSLQSSSGEWQILPEVDSLSAVSNILLYAVPLSAIVGYPFAFAAAVGYLRSASRERRPSAIVALVLLSLFSLLGFIALAIVLIGIVTWISIGA